MAFYRRKFVPMTLPENETEKNPISIFSSAPWTKKNKFFKKYTVVTLCVYIFLLFGLLTQALFIMFM